MLKPGKSLVSLDATPYYHRHGLIDYDNSVKDNLLN